ncbi:MAG: NUDIX hydrolase [Methylovirgula sp.]
MSAARIAAIAAIDIRLSAQPWDFATARVAEIEANWQRRLRGNPALYNGKVLLMSKAALDAAPEGARLAGTCFIAEYKAFQAWRDLGWPGEARNLFAMAALRSADGAYLLGEMAPWTANAGQIYFPSGTPDLDDLAGERLDLEASVWRELREETGFTDADFAAAQGWSVVFDGALIACMKRLQSPLPAADLLARASAFLAREKNPELTRLVPVFAPADIGAGVPDFMQAYLKHAFGRI